MTPSFRRLLIAPVWLAWLLTAPPLQAQVTSASGSLGATSPTYNRSSDRAGFTPSVNLGVPYNVLQVSSSSAGSLMATVQASTAFDAVLTLYSTFDPANPHNNILAADDDSAGYPHAQLSASALAANTTYDLVIASYAASSADTAYPALGGYTINLSGAGFGFVPQVPSTAPATQLRYGGFTANWTGLPSATGYRMDVARDGSFARLLVINQDVGNTTSVNLGGLPPGSSYFYRVRGYDAGGTLTAYSDTASATVPSGQVTSVVVDSSAPQKVVAAVYGVGKFYSTDGGTSWTAASDTSGVGAGPAYESAVKNVTALHRLSTNHATLFAAAIGAAGAAGVATSTDAGVTWGPCANGGLTGLSQNVLTLTQSANATLYAATEAGVYRSSDACTNWAAANTGLTGPASLLAADPADAQRLYAAVYGTGIFITGSAGSSWSSATTQPASTAITALQVKPNASATVFAATYGTGVFISRNNAATWSACTAQPANPNVLTLAMQANGKLYAGTEAGVFVSTDDCASWVALNAGMP